MSPIERMLEAVDWVPVDGNPPRDSYIPYATHTGVLKIDTLEVECVQLNTGQRLITEAGMIAFFEWMGIEPKGGAE